MVTKITILYRVCDNVDMLHCTFAEKAHSENTWSKRFYDIPKPFLIRKCLASVKDVVDFATHNMDFPDNIVVEFLCIHDNCSENMLSHIKNLFPDSKMVACDGNGNGDSFTTCVKLANGMVDDDTIVFFLEDDYTFLSSDGLVKAARMLETVRSRHGKWCALHLDDCPDRYGESFTRENATVAVTPFGHVMGIDSSTCSFMTYVGAVKENFEVLMNFGRFPESNEENSVNLMWKNVPLYCPIPGLTLHCQLRSHIPQYLNADSIKKLMETR